MSSSYIYNGHLAEMVWQMCDKQLDTTASKHFDRFPGHIPIDSFKYYNF